jgi:hypothetical protein
MRAVASDHKAERRALSASVFVPQVGSDARAIVAQILKGNATFDNYAEAREMFAKNALGRELRNAEFSIGQVGKIGEDITRRPPAMIVRTPETSRARPVIARMPARRIVRS